MLDKIDDGVNFCVTVKGVNFSATPLQTIYVETRCFICLLLRRI